MNKIALLKELYQNHIDGEKWLSRVPNDISACFFDNPFVESIYKSNAVLMESIFSEEELESVYWIMYEWSSSPLQTLINDGVEYKFNDIDDIAEYLIDHEGWMPDTQRG